MNSNIAIAKPANFSELGIDALRELAKGKIKSYAKFNKVALREALDTFFNEQAQAEEAAKIEAAAQSTGTPQVSKGMCIICGERKGMGKAAQERHGVGADFSDMCEADYIESGWENEHSDRGHQTGEGAEGGDVADCWVCFPDLKADFISGTYRTGQKGTSRAAMRLTVPVRSAGETKAQVTAARIADESRCTTKITKKAVTLRITTETGEIVLVWAPTGAFNYAASRANGNKVRNVSAALRLLGL